MRKDLEMTLYLFKLNITLAIFYKPKPKNKTISDRKMIHNVNE